MGSPTDVADVEVSIVSLGDATQLTACVKGLPAACSGLAWRLTVVDNSTAGLNLGDLLSTGPPANTVRSEGRRGFAANQNLVLAPAVAERRARYVLILNDDTELDAEAVTRLVRHADGDPRIGAVSPVIRDGRGRREPDLYAWPTLRKQALSVVLPRLTAREPGTSGWLNGAAMLVRTATLEEVGVFDTAFFLFFEETDLCLRMVQAGWNLAICEGASLVHHRHGTTRQHTLDVRIEQQVLRSRYLYFRKHHGSATAGTLSAVSRCALAAARAAKATAAAVVTRRRDVQNTALVLWQLARYRPTRPTALELEAHVQSDLQGVNA